MSAKKPVPGRTRPWAEVQKEIFSPERIAKIESEAELTLMELRKERALTQVELAGRLEINQGTLSKLESQKTMPSLTTLKTYVEGMGGELVLSVVFPDRNFKLSVDRWVRPHVAASASKRRASTKHRDGTGDGSNHSA